MDKNDHKSIWIKTKVVSHCRLIPQNSFKQKLCWVFVDKSSRKLQPQLEAELALIPPPKLGRIIQGEVIHYRKEIFFTKIWCRRSSFSKRQAYNFSIFHSWVIGPWSLIGKSNISGSFNQGSSSTIITFFTDCIILYDVNLYDLLLYSDFDVSASIVLLSVLQKLNGDNVQCDEGEEGLQYLL